MGRIISIYQCLHDKMIRGWRAGAALKFAPKERIRRAVCDSAFMSQKKEIISTLNDLIATLKDGQEGFKQSASGVDDPQLKTLFDTYSLQRSRFAGELQSEVTRMGEDEPEDSGSASGAMHRAWINIKSAVTNRDRHAILAEAERGEDSAVEAYQEALQKDLPAPVRDIVSRQQTEVKAAHDKIRNLRDQAAQT